MLDEHVFQGVENSPPSFSTKTLYVRLINDFLPIRLRTVINKKLHSQKAIRIRISSLKIA